jgi:hypothetical protein
MLNLSSSGSRGRAGHRRPRGAWLSVVAVAGVLALGVPTASVAAVRAGSQPTAAQPAPAQATPAQTTRQYVIWSWARAISFAQQAATIGLYGPDQLVSVTKVTPTFFAIVAVNNDTVYSTGWVDTRVGPAILTVPPTTATFSVQSVDIWGDTIPLNISTTSPGTYALVPPGFTGTLPAGLTKVTIPYPVTFFNIRADKYHDNVNEIAQANAFRAGVRLTTLAKYEADHNAGAVEVLPPRAFAFSFKAAQIAAATLAPTAYLRYTQRVVANPTTLPLSTSELQLAAAFNKDFAAALQARRNGNPVPLARIDAAVRTTVPMISAAWTNDTGPTNWIHQTNFAQWGTDYLARAAGTNYLQWSNSPSSAGYYNAFKDGTGRPLNGARPGYYQLTFPASNIPDAKRFWSVTAYTNFTVAPLPTGTDKFLVASYTPGLVTNPDGSITITIAPTKPAGVPTANWLPAWRAPFNLMLRVYGPTGNTATTTTYTPPAITHIG